NRWSQHGPLFAGLVGLAATIIIVVVSWPTSRNANFASKEADLETLAMSRDRLRTSRADPEEGQRENERSWKAALKAKMPDMMTRDENERLPRLQDSDGMKMGMGNGGPFGEAGVGNLGAGGGQLGFQGGGLSGSKGFGGGGFGGGGFNGG